MGGLLHNIKPDAVTNDEKFIYAFKEGDITILPKHLCFVQCKTPKAEERFSNKKTLEFFCNRDCIKDFFNRNKFQIKEQFKVVKGLKGDCDWIDFRLSFLDGEIEIAKIVKSGRRRRRLLQRLANPRM